MNEGTILAYALIIVLSAGVFLIPGLLTRRAAFEVIRIFCRHKALNVQNAKKADELGLSPRSFFERMGRLRDYKPYALQALEKAKVIRRTEDQRLYMAEEKVSENLKCDPKRKVQR
jgi:hypothetical protein